MQFLLSSLCPSPILSSSAISLDKLLDAGLYTGEVTELVGGPGSGKTQVPMGPTVEEGWGGGCKVLDSMGGGLLAGILVGFKARWVLIMGMTLASVYCWNLGGMGSGLVALPLLQRFRVTQHPILSLKVCLCVAANVAHSLQQNVLYVDSSGGMTASRLLQLLQARTRDEEKQVGGRVVGVP